MRAIVCRELGPPSVLRLETDWPSPAPGPGEVRVRFAACGVNFPDLLTVAGIYQEKPALPFVPGREGAGTVVAAGPGVDAPRVGERVMLRTPGPQGGFAEEATVPADLCFPLPAGMSEAEGAGFIVVYGTAWHALADVGRLRAGETLLVHGAAGGVGLAAVEVGKALGATVIATASTPEKRVVAREHGADHTLDYEADGGFREGVRTLTGGRGADVIFDPVGGNVAEPSLRAIAPEGRLLLVGFTSGDYARLPTNIILVKWATVAAVRFGVFSRAYPERARHNLAQLAALYKVGRLRPRVAQRFPLGEAAAALEQLRDRSVVGKVVLEP
ncbi:MAG: NADPH:quinone oxidoreductase family protein [Alphaproteobacteria bacterium]